MSKSQNSNTSGLCNRFPAEFRVWKDMRRRCRDRRRSDFARYGGRGVRVSGRWDGPGGFANFLADMGPRPSAKHSLDRFPNCHGNYRPGNCRWATVKEQNRNRRNSRRLTFAGETLTVAEWAERTGKPYKTLFDRVYRYGWGTARALNTPTDGTAHVHPILLSKSRCQEIAAAKKSGKTIRALARRYQCCLEVIRKALRAEGHYG